MEVHLSIRFRPVSYTHLDVYKRQVLSSSPASLYASTFQFGAKKHSFPNGKSPWGTIPPRQFLGFNKVTNEKVIKLIKDHFAE